VVISINQRFEGFLARTTVQRLIVMLNKMLYQRLNRAQIVLDETFLVFVGRVEIERASKMKEASSACWVGDHDEVVLAFILFFSPRKTRAPLRYFKAFSGRQSVLWWRSVFYPINPTAEPLSQKLLHLHLLRRR
jgi:hypothetical protein